MVNSNCSMGFTLFFRVRIQIWQARAKVINVVYVSNGLKHSNGAGVSNADSQEMFAYRHAKLRL